MRSLGIFTIFAALTAFSALAAKVDTDTGEGCFGVGCFDGEVTVPDVDPVDIDIVLPEYICETLADRIYQLCLAGDGASGPACAVERDTALDQCENPSDHVEDPAGQVDAGDLPTPPAPGPISTGTEPKSRS